MMTTKRQVKKNNRASDAQRSLPVLKPMSQIPQQVVVAKPMKPRVFVGLSKIDVQPGLERISFGVGSEDVEVEGFEMRVPLGEEGVVNE